MNAKNRQPSNDDRLPFEERTADYKYEFLSKFSKNTATGSVEYTAIEEEQALDFTAAFSRGIASIKETFYRMLDHVKSFAAGVFIQIMTLIVPFKGPINPVFPIFASYIGLLMLFPARPNRFALGVGLIGTLIAVLSGYWPIALGIGGIIAAITGIRDRDIDNRIFFVTIPLAFLALAFAFYKTGNDFPTISLIGLGITTLFGLIAPPKIRRKFSYYFMSPNEKKAYLAEEKAIQAEIQRLEAEAKIREEKNAKFALFARHVEVLEKLENEVDSLPEDLSLIINAIGMDSAKIIRAMEKDSRDIITGGRFLNRYLPLVQDNLIRYQTIMAYQPKESEKIHIDTIRSMNAVRQAFDQVIEQLIENDLHDLQIDFNVTDTLLKSQGFEIR